MQDTSTDTEYRHGVNSRATWWWGGQWVRWWAEWWRVVVGWVDSGVGSSPAMLVAHHAG